jgi:phosphatidylglycerophosphatase C
MVGTDQALTRRSGSHQKAVFGGKMENRVRNPETPEASPTEPARTLANLVAFDFDGTLTVRDTFLAFLFWRTRGLSRLVALIRMVPSALAYVWRRDRGRIKAAAVKAFLGGVEAGTLAGAAERFADLHYDDLMRPDALDRWARHKAQGDRVVIVTASPEQIIAPFAERLGADTLIGTRLHLDEGRRVTGRFDGENCRGEEKVRRILQCFGPIRLSAAYGDTTGDVEMLAMADEPHMKLFKRRPGRMREPGASAR